MKKKKHFKFPEWCIFKISRRVRQNKTSQQIQEEQINFLSEDVEKNLDGYKKALELNGIQLSDVKKILIMAKQSYNKVVSENKELKKYFENIKQRYNQYLQQQQPQYTRKIKRLLHWRSTKKNIKK